jgi:hypothetical protein
MVQGKAKAAGEFNSKLRYRRNLREPAALSPETR